MSAPGDADAYVKSLGPPIRVIAAALRDMVRSTAPDFEEKLKYGAPHYDVRGTAGTVVYIMDAADHVNLGFYDGVDLEDPGKRLDGTGKRLRHAKVFSVAQARDPALRTLVREAAAFRVSGGPRKRSR